MGNDEQDPEARGYVAILRRGLAELGWIDGDNLRLEVRWGNADPDRIRVYAKELVGLRPDLIVSHTTPVTAALHRETRSLPIVFLIVSDPVGAGFVESLAHPGGNITGLISFEADIAGKWLEILTEVSPSVNRAAILFNPETAAGNGTYYLKPFEKAARDLAVQAIVSPVRSEPEIVAAISAVSQHPSGGIVVMTDVFMFVHRATVIRLAEKLRLPAVYYQAVFAREGGLVSYRIRQPGHIPPRRPVSRPGAPRGPPIGDARANSYPVADDRKPEGGQGDRHRHPAIGSVAGR